MKIQISSAKSSWVVCAALALGVGWASPAPAGFVTNGSATYLHETMAMGATGSGSSVSFGDQINARFISGALFEIPFGLNGEVTSVGGHLSGGNQSADIGYAAIVRLPSPGSLPSSPGDPNPLGNSTIVAANAFGGFPQGSSSSERSTPMPATLTSGSYAVVFGAGGFVDDLLFGPGGFVQPSLDDLTDGTLVNGFFLQFPTNPTITDTVIRWNSFGNTWTVDSSNNNIRMFVEGSLVVPEPGSLALLAVGILSLAIHRRRPLRTVG
jgi:hypothetical protein